MILKQWCINTQLSNDRIFLKCYNPSNQATSHHFTRHWLVQALGTSFMSHTTEATGKRYSSSKETVHGNDEKLGQKKKEREQVEQHVRGAQSPVEKPEPRRGDSDH